MAIEPQIHPTAIVYPGTKLGEGDPLQAARDGVVVVRALEQLQASLEAVAA